MSARAIKHCVVIVICCAALSACATPQIPPGSSGISQSLQIQGLGMSALIQLLAGWLSSRCRRY